MKRIFGYMLYTIICAAVITAAIRAGINGHYCHECAIAFGEKEEGNNRVLEISRYTRPLVTADAE